MDHDCHDNEVTHSEGVTCLVCSQSNNDFIHISDPQDDVEYNEKVCEKNVILQYCKKFENFF